ncbi:hypothetical protein VP01_2239g3 [Puccinia sorghi]|uniref:Uncharacterized protein n=1 Tax=Puccinia sorghi TaxID=27349 RepID=A0A0L6V8L0_9BASI|nr:hypothetical protein VP01_2239g3 [Puccinia sorghi]
MVTISPMDFTHHYKWGLTNKSTRKVNQNCKKNSLNCLTCMSTAGDIEICKWNEVKSALTMEEKRWKWIKVESPISFPFLFQKLFKREGYLQNQPHLNSKSMYRMALWHDLLIQQSNEPSMVNVLLVVWSALASIMCAQHRHSRVRFLNFRFLCTQNPSPREFGNILARKLSKNKEKQGPMAPIIHIVLKRGWVCKHHKLYLEARGRQVLETRIGKSSGVANPKTRPPAPITTQFKHYSKFRPSPMILACWGNTTALIKINIIIKQIMHIKCKLSEFWCQLLLTCSSQILLSSLFIYFLPSLNNDALLPQLLFVMFLSINNVLILFPLQIFVMPPMSIVILQCPIHITLLFSIYSGHQPVAIKSSSQSLISLKSPHMLLVLSSNIDTNYPVRVPHRPVNMSYGRALELDLCLGEHNSLEVPTTLGVGCTFRTCATRDYKALQFGNFKFYSHTFINSKHNSYNFFYLKCDKSPFSGGFIALRSKKGYDNQKGRFMTFNVWNGRFSQSHRLLFQKYSKNFVLEKMKFNIKLCTSNHAKFDVKTCQVM